MADAVTAALKALADAIDGMPLADTGNTLHARPGRQDGGTPPFASVRATGVRWLGTMRADGHGVLDAEVLVVLPSQSEAVADALADRAMADMRARILTQGGRNLGGAVASWRLNDARRGPTTLGGREQPAVTFRIELWTTI